MHISVKHKIHKKNSVKSIKMMIRNSLSCIRISKMHEIHGENPNSFTKKYQPIKNCNYTHIFIYLNLNSDS